MSFLAKTRNSFMLWQADKQILGYETLISITEKRVHDPDISNSITETLSNSREGAVMGRELLARYSDSFFASEICQWVIIQASYYFYKDLFSGKFKPTSNHQVQTHLNSLIQEFSP